MKYTILKKCYIRNRVLEKGYEIDTELMPLYAEAQMDDLVLKGFASKAAVKEPPAKETAKK